MSPREVPIGPVPEHTARVARAAFPRGNVWMWLRESFGPTSRGVLPVWRQERPAEAAWRLALVSVMQFAEELSDEDAADAVRARIDWKYALGLPLDDSGFDASVLRQFRMRLLTSPAERTILDRFLALCREQGCLRAHGRRWTATMDVLAAIDTTNRLETV